mmetsp:Transcript_21423/g.51594  ORF Transcript_21423/g.51594 Transcript_21423/m.51594 type:complete len:350 (+) Transcript_21423:389-1438(+)
MYVVFVGEALCLPVLVHPKAHVDADDGVLPPHAGLLPLHKGPELLGGPVEVVCALRPPPEQVWLAPPEHSSHLGGHVEYPLLVLYPPKVPRHPHIGDRAVVHVDPGQRPHALLHAVVPRAPGKRLEGAAGPPRRPLVAVRKVEPPLEFTIHQVVLPVSVSDHDPPRLKAEGQPHPEAQQLRPEPHNAPGLPYEVGQSGAGLDGWVLVSVKHSLNLPRHPREVPRVLYGEVIAPDAHRRVRHGCNVLGRRESGHLEFHSETATHVCSVWRYELQLQVVKSARHSWHFELVEVVPHPRSLSTVDPHNDLTCIRQVRAHQRELKVGVCRVEYLAWVRDLDFYVCTSRHGHEQ